MKGKKTERKRKIVMMRNSRSKMILPKKTIRKYQDKMMKVSKYKAKIRRALKFKEKMVKEKQWTSNPKNQKKA